MIMTPHIAAYSIGNLISPNSNALVFLLRFFRTVSTPSRGRLTGPTFCTRASERVYITTSSGEDANGGSQGAVGDRRAAICGENVPGAGGLYPSAECGRLVLYSTRHFSITICASFSE